MPALPIGPMKWDLVPFLVDEAKNLQKFWRKTNFSIDQIHF